MYVCQGSCAVVGCTNSTYSLDKWLQATCLIHQCPHWSDICTCPEPFKLLTFPKVPDIKKEWEKRVNRFEPINRTVKYGNKVIVHKKGDVWSANPQDKICSLHFVDGMPTPANPLPTINMAPNVEVLTTKKQRKASMIRSPVVPKKR